MDKTGVIQVDTNALESGSSQLTTVMNDVTSMMGNLGAAVNSAASGWNGQSKGAFLDMWQRWSGAMGQLVTVLEKTASFLTEAASEYEETDRTAVNVQ